MHNTSKVFLHSCTGIYGKHSSIHRAEYAKHSYEKSYSAAIYQGFTDESAHMTVTILHCLQCVNYNRCDAAVL